MLFFNLTKINFIVKSLSKIFEGTVYLTARNEERGLDSLKSLSAYKNIKFHPLDISDPNSIHNFAQHIKECYKGMFNYIFKSNYKNTVLDRKVLHKTLFYGVKLP